MSEAGTKELKEKIEQLEKDLRDRDSEIGILKSEQGKDREIVLLSRAKAKVQEERDRLKDRNKTLEAAAQQDATIRRALLLLIGVMKHDIAHLHSMGADETLPSEEFTAEAMQVLEKIQGAFKLADLPLVYPVDQGTTTGVVAKIVEPKQEVG